MSKQAHLRQIDLETFHMKASMSIEICFLPFLIYMRLSGSSRILRKVIEFEMYRKECDNKNDDSDRDDKLLEWV